MTTAPDPKARLITSSTPAPFSAVEVRVPSVDHAGELEDLTETPRYLMPRHESGVPIITKVSCSYCGVGDGGRAERVPEVEPATDRPAASAERGSLCRIWVERASIPLSFEARLLEGGSIEVLTRVPLVAPGGVLRCVTETDTRQRGPFVGREIERKRAPDGTLLAHVLRPFAHNLTVYREVLENVTPTSGCIKLRHSMMRQRAAYPIQLGPSELDGERRRPLTYNAAITKLADLLLEHRAPHGRTLLYASGQVDYFAIFAMQEVFRLLGVRNLTGNAEHCLNAGAVHNEMLTGQEGPFVRIEQALQGDNRFYLFNGWNGFISHPPVFRALLAKNDLDAYLVEVMVTESAKALAEKLDADRILLIRPRSDPHLALAVAHEILRHHAQAVSSRFVERFANRASFEAYTALAASERFAPERVAERIAPEPRYADRLLRGIRRIALKLAQQGVVPINIPSVGLSQTSGAVTHCLWGSALGLVGKYGLDAVSSVAGGTLRLPGQINAETEVQGLSRKFFMGRIPMSEAADAARRMDLPDDAYEAVVRDPGRAALDYSDPTPGTRELFICMGTQFEANMMGRKRWLDKLSSRESTLVVIDPIIDSWSERHAALIVPSPPHPATTKLYQNGEWKLTLSVPQKRAGSETRSDATILYDAMAEISRRVEFDPEVAAEHPDLARHARSGYLARRFCAAAGGGGLTRIDGEVSRQELWQRIQSYMSGGKGALYCRPEHDNGRPIEWTELLERGSLYYGGVGSTRYVLEYDNPEAHPFRDVYRQPTRFKFFTPTDADLEIPSGVVLNSGRSTLSDERQAIAFAIGTFNSGKATPIVGMPDENPLFVSPALAQRHGIANGQRVRMTNPDTGGSAEFPAIVSDRVKGEMVYASFHKSRAQMDGRQYINDVTSHVGRCAYTSQTSVKATHVLIEPAALAPPSRAPRSDAPHRGAASERPMARRRRIDTRAIDPRIDLPIWSGRDTPLYVTEIIRDTHDVYTFRLQGDPLCRFVYYPGQFCTLVLDIDGKKVVRSYSISSSPTRPFALEITIKRVPGGLVSNWLPDNLHVGDRLEISGPKGRFCLTPGQIPSKLLFLAAGSGITPLMSMTRWLCDLSAGVDVKLLNSVKTPDDLVFHQELEMLGARFRNIEAFATATGEPSGNWSGLTGRLSREMLERTVPDLADRQVYMCGPEGFMAAARSLLEQTGFDLSRLHSESFAPPRSVSEEGVHSNGASRIPSAFPGSADAVTIEFAKSGRRITGSRKLALLDLAEAHGVEIDYACRTGSCGACKVRLLSGELRGDTGVGLTQREKQEGFVLSCVASPVGDCVVDA